MYKCDECGTVFTNPKAFYERHGLDCPPYERCYCCPNCNNVNFKDYEEAEDDE